jgi:hypothetical protein
MPERHLLDILKQLSAGPVTLAISALPRAPIPNLPMRPNDISLPSSVNVVMLSNVADLTDVLSAMANDGHTVTPELVACASPYMREHIRRVGKFALDMNDLPDPLNPQPLPFVTAL